MAELQTLSDASRAEAIQDRLERLHGYFREYDYADAEDLKGLQDTLIDLGLEVSALRAMIARAE